MGLSIIKKKGQIVPKRFIKAIEKKSQHLVKFGCDVEIIGNTIYLITEGAAIVIPSVKYCNTKKRKRLVKGFEWQLNRAINGSRLNDQSRYTAIFIESSASFQV